MAVAGVPGLDPEAFLCDTDLGDVLEETIEAQTKWKKIGLKLRVPNHILNAIKRQHDSDDDRLSDMLEHWLKSVNPKPTWKALVEVLRSPLIKEEQLAEKLEGKYCSSAEPAILQGDKGEQQRQQRQQLNQGSSKKSDSEEFETLKGDLAVYKKTFAKPNTDRNAVITLMQQYIEQYIETALEAGVSVESLQKQMRSLCFTEFLIPSVLEKWVLQQVEEISHKFTGTPSVLPLPLYEEDRSDEPPLFCKDTLYHASLCCHAVSTCNAGNFQNFFNHHVYHSGHCLEEVSMSISQYRENVDRYLIAYAKKKSVIYVAFQSEATISAWKENHVSFDEGLKKQTSRIPLRFFIEQLRDNNKIVLTGFSFGGMLACCVAALIWDLSYIPVDVLERSVMCITFGQPLISIPNVQDVIKKLPQFKKTIHSVFSKDDVVPQLLRYFRTGCLHYRSSSSSTKTLQILSSSDQPAKSSSVDPSIKMGFHGIFASSFLQSLATLQETVIVQQQTYSGAVASRNSSGHGGKAEEALRDLKSLLSAVISYDGRDPDVIFGTCYMISCEEGYGLTWQQIPEQMAAQELGNLSKRAIEELEANIFKPHNMEDYRRSTFRGYLEKPPDKYTVPANPAKRIKDVSVLKPEVEAVEFHEYPTECVIVLEGNNLWFCHEIRLETCSIDSPAQSATKHSIQFSFTLSPELESLTADDGPIKATLYSHFANPIRRRVPIKKEPFSFSRRQMQLAKHTPSEIIQLAYWSAMLEWHPKQGIPSTRFREITKFLEEAVDVVPIESIFFAVAYSDSDTALKCAKAIKATNPKVPPSEMARYGLQRAAIRMRTGVEASALDKMLAIAIRRIPGDPNLPVNITTSATGLSVSRLSYFALPALTTPSSSTSRLNYADVTRHSTSQRLPLGSIPVRLIKTEVVIPLPHPQTPNAEVVEVADYLEQLLNKVSAQANAAAQRGHVDVVCNKSIECVYPVYLPRKKTLCVSTLQSPLGVLREAKQKLVEAQEYKKAGTEGTEAWNNKMLALVQDIKESDLKICVALLGSFLEQQIRIPLLKSPMDTAKVLSSRTAPVAVGVWALFSMSYRDLDELLSRTEGKSLQVEIADYVSSILSPTPKSSKSRSLKLYEQNTSEQKYAGKLQFMLQGIKKTVSCSNQYISYFLERQLCSNLRFNKSISVKDLINDWDKIFEGDALSLVAKSHRPLIARWLKWAVLIHDLREALASYTCVGVIGLINSGKTQLVNTLFGVQAHVGTTKSARTTIPFMYNLDGIVDGLDVIDFPGVDDKDHSVPELANLLISLAQVVIFVVDYRKISSDPAKTWLRELKNEAQDIPVLVCLTHADRLYAEGMKEEKGDPNPTGYKKQKIGRALIDLEDELGYHPSRTMGFYCFCLEPDSNLKLEDLKRVGICSPLDVGEWMVDTFKRLNQKDLAERLHSFIHTPAGIK